MGELLEDLIYALDPAKFMRALGFKPDPWQERYLQTASKRHQLLCCRQSGKTTSTAVKVLHRAIYYHSQLILLLSPSDRQSGELFRTITEFYDELDEPVPSKKRTERQLELINKSRIIALPGKEKTIRGYSGANMIIVDEASRVEDALYFSIRPMLQASRGSLYTLSTAFGQRGWFFDDWMNAKDEFEQTLITADDCPRFDPVQLAHDRRRMGENWYLQEYFCKFLDPVTALFSYEAIEGAADEEILALFDTPYIEAVRELQSAESELSFYADS